MELDREATVSVKLKVKEAKALLGPPSDDEITDGGLPWVQWVNCRYLANVAVRRALEGAARLTRPDPEPDPPKRSRLDAGVTAAANAFLRMGGGFGSLSAQTFPG